jgi:hypothetical protein
MVRPSRCHRFEYRDIGFMVLEFHYSSQEKITSKTITMKTLQALLLKMLN